MPVVIRPDQVPVQSWTDHAHSATTRGEIAVLIWRVVAEFIGDTTPLDISGLAPWSAAEDYIRAHAEEAESETIMYHHGLPEVISGVLIPLGVYDDYWRIKRDEQHMAFAGEDTNR
jgi:hypothetical protein